ncbi:MAG: dihydrolipoyllysine-residue acetyltransferase [Geminicoccaceae bacterium]|nr:dihydrolipoyllysine-residue acetyltransferase [Geminicoccaceae bacterium]
MSKEVKVPDIGDFTDVEIIEVHVQAGDDIHEEDAIVTLETDKASMEVPSPASGKVGELKVKVGDRVSEGSVLLLLEGGEASSKVDPPSPEGHQESDAEPIEHPEPVEQRTVTAMHQAPDFSSVHASPAVRRLARELDIDLNQVKGTGDKGRITREDVKAMLAGADRPAGAPAALKGGAGIPEIDLPDFSKFGAIEEKPLSRIKKISGPHLHRAWLNVPAVTHNDEADITETDAYRKELDNTAKADGYRVTLLSFLIKASVSALKKHPEVNSSLNASKDALILKKYVHVGVAVDTPDGLVVPVIRDVDKKGIDEISRDLGEMSKKARDGKLGSADLQGASFTISSLGGIGGTGFSPIVNAPEVAILGVVRAKMAPVWSGGTFVPRLMLPVCLSYDHRVIDGALAARFTRHLCHVLEDVRRLVL